MRSVKSVELRRYYHIPQNFLSRIDMLDIKSQEEKLVRGFIEEKGIKTKNPIIVEGLPGLDSVGKIVAEELMMMASR